MSTTLFKLGPLNRNLTTAIGSALRRYALSSIKGTAVTALRMRGTMHEHVRLPGIREDVHQIIDNLRKLVIAGTVEGPTWLRIDKNTAGDIAAADFAPLDGLSFPQPSQHIATSTDAATGFRLDVEVRSGVGYRAAQENRLRTHGHGTIVVDSAFSPVTRSSLDLEGDDDAATARLGIQTNGAVSPHQALAEATAALLRDLESPFDLEELTDADGRFTSRWLPRGRATTLGNLIEAGLLFGSAHDALDNVDVSFDVEPGDFLDNPDEERLVLTVKAAGGASPRERTHRALDELRPCIRNTTDGAEISSEPAPSVLFKHAFGECGQRRFERTPIGVEMPDPLALQRESFERFAARDLSGRGQSSHGLGWLLEQSLNVDCGTFGELELLGWNLDEAAGDTHSLTATLRLTRPNEDVIEQHVRIANVPAMTSRGSFVVRGRERICIGQLVLAPGVYFHYKSRSQTHEARVVPHHGMDIRFDFGRDGAARVMLDRRRPMAAEVLLRALGCDESHGDADGLSQADAMRELGRILSPALETDTGPDVSSALLDTLGYSLGDLGRDRMNQRLGTTGEGHTLGADDVAAILRKLAELRDGEGEVDDLNHMKNLIVRGVGDSLFQHIRPAFAQARRNVAAGLGGDLTQSEESEGPADVEGLVGRPIQDALDDFFLRCSLVRDFDTTNSLSMIAQARQVTRSGPGGLDKSRAGLPARYIHPSHYARLCVIDTPEGENLGLLRSLSMYAKLDEHGFVLAPYMKVEDGNVTDEIVYLAAEEEDEHMLAPADVPRADGKGVGERIVARKGYDYHEASPKEIEFVGVSPSEILGAPAHCIPLIEFDDTNRSLMGANMSRQAVRTLKPDQPIVATGYEGRFAQCVSSPSDVLSQGKNVLVGFVTWGGYNYEDGLVISERLIRDHAFTSIHVRELEIETYQTADSPERLTNELPGADAELCLHLDARGIARVGAEVRSGDVLVGKVTRDEQGNARDASLRMPRGCDGKVVETEHQTRRVGFDLPTGVEERVRVVVAVRRELKCGDKLANRHGAKGVVATILPQEDMPCLADGTPLDVACNPLGVPSRMNIGQLMEAHLSLAAAVLGVQIISPPLNGATAADAKALLREAGLPEDGRLQLYDGRTGKPFDQKSAVGFVYWHKLVHMADDAIQARSTGAYDPATQQPVRGRKRRGGQKVGKMEIWALQSHGAAHNLREFLSIKADDAIGRRRIYDAIAEGREDEAFRAPELANVLLRELRAVGLDVRYMKDGAAVDVDEPYEINRVSEVRIAFASADGIRGWSKGEVVSETSFDEETGEPVAGGLFCQRVFGPIRALQCACGTVRGEERWGDVCEECGATVLDWRARFRRMGHVELAVPVLHPWVLKVEPNPLCALLGLDKAAVEDILYCRKHLVLDPKGTELHRGQLLDDDGYRAARERLGYGFQAAMGAGAIAGLLESADVEEAKADLMRTATPETRAEVAEAVALLSALGGDAGPCSRGVLEVIPVLPAGLRPSAGLNRERIVTSDLNELYERVIKRSNRLKALLAMKTPPMPGWGDIMLRDEQRLLQEAVDALFGNGYRGHSIRGSREMVLASLSDRLKGTKGRFIQGLAGKRADYSARAVIAAGPDLALEECTVPKEAALELFRPFVVGELVRTHKAKSRGQAEHMVSRQRCEAYRALKEIIRDKVVLLVRAPSLHKYNVLAFRPVLSNERVIRIHPDVNPGFNADFDGDQMTIHVPLSEAAHEEAKGLLMAPRNIFATATGGMITKPNQEVILGCYYMTFEREGAAGEDESFDTALAARNAWKAGRVDAHARIRVQLPGGMIETTVGRIMFNDLLPECIDFVNEPIGHRELQTVITACYLECDAERTARLLDAIRTFGFRHVTLSGMSFWRADPYSGRERFLAEMDAQLADLRRQCEADDIDDEQRYLRAIDLWSDAQNRLREQVVRELNETDEGFLPVSMMVRSGSRGSAQQMLSLFGMSGLAADMFGRIIEFPARECMMNGLGELGYFLKANGARGGLAMTVLRIASAGDLMRRIVEALEDVVVVEEDCCTVRGFEMGPVTSEGRIVRSFADRARGRVAAEDVRDASGKTILVAGDEIDDEKLSRLAQVGIERTKVRSPLTCESRGGVCAKCYGHDVGQKRPVEVGAAVGITAAMSLGEPLTQLTMRSFHTGHQYPFSKIARGKPEQDVKYSSAFPRLEEVFMMLEKRRARGRAIDGVDERPSPQSILDQGGEDAARQYVVDELTRVYAESHVHLNSKHFEIAARQMMSHVEIEEPGDTGLIVGRRIRREELAEANENAAREGGRPAAARPLLLPITEVALRADSFLAASASWETVSVLTKAALREDVDHLRGMRENVILGRLIPAGTGRSL